MTKKEILNLIKQEVLWCQKHPLNLSSEYRLGFIKGLRQVATLIKKAPKKK